MKAYLLSAAFAMVFALGAVAVVQRPARGQLGGAFMSCGSWTSSEGIVRGGAVYMPKLDADARATVCLGYDGILYVLASRSGSPTDLVFLSLATVPIVY